MNLKRMHLKHLIAAWLLASAGMLASAAPARTANATFEPGSLERIVAAHKGRAFVLILWSLDCPFCQASMIALAREKRSRPRLNIVTLGTDPQGDPQTDALVSERLRGVGLSQGAWSFGATAPEQLRYAVDPKWHGELPRSYWYDARGKRVAYSGLLTPAIVGKLSGR